MMAVMMSHRWNHSLNLVTKRLAGKIRAFEAIQYTRVKSKGG